MSKLSPEQVAEIRRLHAEGFTPYRIAKLFGVRPGSVRHRLGLAPRRDQRKDPRLLYRGKNSMAAHILKIRYSPMVEAALCSLTPGLRKYLDADDELRRQLGRK